MYKFDEQLANQKYLEANGVNVEYVLNRYANEPSTRNSNDYLELLENQEKASTWFRAKPNFFRKLAFFIDHNGYKISIYHPHYAMFINELRDTFSNMFVKERAFCNPGEMPDFTAQLTNHPGFKAYPFQVTMGGQEGILWSKNDYEVEVIDSYLSLILAKVRPSDFVFPKKSNVGAPSLNTGLKPKLFIMEKALRNFHRISDLLDDECKHTTSLSSNDRFEELYYEYSISCIATQGIRVQNDKHGSSGKVRNFYQYGRKMSTVVDITDLKGFFARRTRIVIGLNYGTNCLTNLVLAPIRNYYYDIYCKTYKVRSQTQLNDEFKNVHFIFGVDVTQLDNNTAGERVDYYCSKIVDVVSDQFKPMYKKLFLMSTHPAVFFRPSSSDIGFYCDGNPKAVSNDELSKNVSIGIPSGISATSELGKFEVTSYFLIQIKRVHDQFDKLLQDASLLKSFKSFLDEQLSIGALNVSKLQLKSFGVFDNPVASYSDYNKFIHEFLANHCGGHFVIKNTGDDTVLGTHCNYLYFFFCLMTFVRQGNDSPSSKLFRSLPLVDGYDVCNWHKIDAEEPLSYLGNLLYKVNNCWEFKYNPSSFIINTILPENDILAGNKLYTWGLGYLSRCEVYRQNPFMEDIINKFENIFARCFNTEQCSKLAQRHVAQMSQYSDSANYTLADQIFIDNPDSIYYKVDVNDLSPGVFEQQFSYLPLNNMKNFYKDLFKSEILEL